MNRPEHSQVRERCLKIIPLSCDSSPKVVFIWHSRFPDSNLPRVYLENLSETNLCRKFERNAKRTEESRRYDRFMGMLPGGRGGGT